MQFTHEREFTYTRAYRGPIRAVIFDWAGTTMDFGCMAPAVVFQKVYDKAGVPISMEEARVPMGAHKKVHIGLIAQIPSVRRRWVDTHSAEPTDKDVDTMFEDFVPMQEACLSDYSTLIPGTLEVVPNIASVATRSVRPRDICPACWPSTWPTPKNRAMFPTPPSAPVMFPGAVPLGTWCFATSSKWTFHQCNRWSRSTIR